MGRARGRGAHQDILRLWQRQRAKGGSSVTAGTKFTRRQREVAALLSAGFTVDEIGSRLSISARTARAHVEVLKRKLDVSRSRDIPAEFQRRTGVNPIALALLMSETNG